MTDPSKNRGSKERTRAGSTREDASTPTSSIELPPFELNRQIGTGGMGEVWRGRHPDQDVPVALKFVTEAMRDHARYRRNFRTEVRSVAALNHPGIITLLDYGETTDALRDATAGRLPADCPYLVMELANAGSIESLFGELDWPLLRGILLELLDALAHAHARGVIHRDIKPGNVLLDRAPIGELKLKLTDFGLAFIPEQAFDEGEGYDETCGTPHYMAPEQFRARWRDFGPSTDLYGLGCLAWELVTGEYLYDGPGLMAIARQHLVEPLPDFEPTFEVPDRLHNWLATLLQKHPRDRFRTAADAGASLLGIDPSAPDAAADVPKNLLGRGGSSFPSEWSPQLVTLRLDTIDRFANLPDSIAHLARRREEREARESDAPDRDGPATNDPAPLTRRPPPMPDGWSQRAPAPRPMTLVGAGLELFGLRDFPMVGHEQLRDRLWSHLKTVVEGGGPRLSFLHGPAGVGKTRLARWIGDRAEEVGAARPLRVVHEENAAPMAGLATAIARRVGCDGMSPEEAEGRLKDWYEARGVEEPYEWRAMTTLLRPALDTDDGNEDSETEPRITFSSNQEKLSLLRRFLGYLSAERPVVLHLDDIPWGRPALQLAGELLGTLPDRPGLYQGRDAPATNSALPIYIVATYRDETLVERPLEQREVDALRDEYADERVDTLDVPPLDDGAQRRLVEYFLQLAPAVAHRIAARAQGNPLFAIQLVKDWVDRGLLVVGPEGFELRDDARAAELPGDLYEVWSARLDRALEGQPRAVCRAIALGAVLGREPRADLWEAACVQASLPFPTEALKVLLKNRLVEDAPNGWAFTHNMLRETLHRRTREHGAWRSFNRACAAVLAAHLPEHAPGRHERIAEHLLVAEAFEAALDPLLEAIELRGRAGDTDAASYLLERFQLAADAIELADEDPRAGQVQILRGRLATLTGALQEAEAIFRELLARDFDEKFDDGGDVRLLEARTLVGLANVLQRTGRLEDALSRMDDAKRRVDEADAPILKGRLLRQIGEVQKRSDRPDVGIDTIREAIRTFRRAPAAEVEVAKALASQAVGHRFSGDTESARTLHREALSIFEARGVRFGVARSLSALADLARIDGDLEAARDYYARASRIAGQLEIADLAVVPAGAIELALAEEDWQRAADLAASWREKWQEAASAPVTTVVIALQTQAHAQLGQWSRTEELLGRLGAIAEHAHYADSDLAEPLTRIAELAKEAGRDAVTQKFGALAARMWRDTGDDERAEKLVEKLELPTGRDS